MTLVLENLRCGYRGTSVIAGVSARVGAGEVLCLLGPNGTGKTTLFKSVLGLIPLLGGRVVIHRQDGPARSAQPISRTRAKPHTGRGGDQGAQIELHSLSPAARAREIAYVPQDSQNPFAFTVAEVALMGRTAHLGPFGTPGAQDRRIATDALARLGVEDLADRPFSQLSGGQRQMVLIARAIAQQARVIMLDEPTSSLDFGNQAKVLEQILALRTAGIAVVLTTHAPEHAFLLGGHVLLLRDGAVFAAGQAAEVLTSETLSAAYGVPVHVGQVQATGRVLTTCQPIIGTATDPAVHAENHLTRVERKSPS